MYKIEIGEDSKASTCSCCNEESCISHGFIYRNGDPYGVYYAGWSNAHLEKKVSLALAVGEWNENSTANSRTCFGLETYEAQNEILF